MIIAIKAPVGGQFRMYDTYDYLPDFPEDEEEEMVECERCGDVVPRSRAVSGYGVNMWKYWCKHCEHEMELEETDNELFHN